MIKKTPQRMIHCIAHCQVCFNQNEDVDRAEKWAREHTKDTGHRVSIEKGMYYNTYVSP